MASSILTRLPTWCQCLLDHNLMSWKYFFFFTGSILASSLIFFLKSKLFFIILQNSWTLTAGKHGGTWRRRLPAQTFDWADLCEKQTCTFVRSQCSSTVTTGIYTVTQRRAIRAAMEEWMGRMNNGRPPRWHCWGTASLALWVRWVSSPPTPHPPRSAGLLSPHPDPLRQAICSAITWPFRHQTVF